jgi:hypothetical protein
VSDEERGLIPSESMVMDIKRMFDSVYRCIDRNNYIPWIDYANEVLSLAFTHHRYIIVSQVNRKIEESYRPLFSPEVLSLRKSINLLFYLGSECVEALNEIIVFAEFLMNTLVSRKIVTRTAVGLARLIAMIQRSITNDSSYLSYSSLKKLLVELYQHILAALAVLKSV